MRSFASTASGRMTAPAPHHHHPLPHHHHHSHPHPAHHHHAPPAKLALDKDIYTQSVSPARGHRSR